LLKGFVDLRMSEDIIKILVSSSLEERALIVRRKDGAYTYRRQWLSHMGWGPSGLDCPEV
jgi:hypothetical protein